MMTYVLGHNLSYLKFDTEHWLFFFLLDVSFVFFNQWRHSISIFKLTYPIIDTRTCYE